MAWPIPGFSASRRSGLRSWALPLLGLAAFVAGATLAHLGALCDWRDVERVRIEKVLVQAYDYSQGLD